jgi:hypothetical protein
MVTIKHLVNVVGVGIIIIGLPSYYLSLDSSRAILVT